MNECEHELNPVDENWMSEDTLQTTLECRKCKARFVGILIKDIPHGEAGQDSSDTSLLNPPVLPKKLKGGID